MNILIADDNAFMRRMLRDMLERRGYKVIGEAVNGQDAFEKYRLLKPDVVTMDITMPIVSGLDAVKLINTYDPLAKVIMCSAMGQQPLVIQAMQSGAKDFIVKPFKEERVIETLQRLSK